MPASSNETTHPIPLERDSILNDILAHIDSYAHHDPAIDCEALKEHVLRPVLANTFDPEVQLRGFLRALRRTSSFAVALEGIQDGEVRAKVESFVDGKSVKEVLGGKGFAMPKGGHRQVGANEQKRKENFGERLVNGIADAVDEVVFKVLDAKEEVESRLDVMKERLIDGSHAHPEIYEDEAETKVMEVHHLKPFSNWGENIRNTPLYTFVPTTVLGIQNIVRFAIANDLRVRCAGYRHSWSSIFSSSSSSTEEDNDKNKKRNNTILISFVNLTEVTTLPDPMSLPHSFSSSHPNELQTIELLPLTAHPTSRPESRLCRIGAATTSESLRLFLTSPTSKWTLPVSPILVEVTLAGITQTICHGAGRLHPTISDFVRRVEYVDCRGVLQSLNIEESKEGVRAVAGAFGLIGVITHITLELDRMRDAVMRPRKVDVTLAIPPLSKEDVPEALRGEWWGARESDSEVEEKIEEARKKFVRRARDDYYSEWFWFAFQRKAWVNTWDVVEVGDAEGGDAVEYPDDAAVFLQWLEGWLGGVLTSSKFFNAIPGHWQAQLLATSGMAALPPMFGEDETPTIKTQLPKALHFRRGTQNMRVRDTEFQIPIPPHPSNPNEPDFSVVQRAWWDAINLVYSSSSSASGAAPMRLTLELRIMGGSNVLLAPQYGNGPWGTASIEVLSVPDAARDGEWEAFVQKVADVWMGYECPYPSLQATQSGNEPQKTQPMDKTYLNVRPHWAKEWESIKMHGIPAKKYLKEFAYKEQIPAFRDVLRRIGEGKGWGLRDLKERFSNELWDELVFDGV
ncbi:putative fad-binding type 2 protein [Favolaschia claudopus]|uniref:Fad-binding type 2 protein n=1 Tax=Favolaschia claudopus TaxID=2862362 RepID=A0AAV9ZKU3_9AGAR